MNFLLTNEIVGSNPCLALIENQGADQGSYFNQNIKTLNVDNTSLNYLHVVSSEKNILSISIYIFLYKICNVLTKVLDLRIYLYPTIHAARSRLCCFNTQLYSYVK